MDNKCKKKTLQPQKNPGKSNKPLPICRVLTLCCIIAATLLWNPTAYAQTRKIDLNLRASNLKEMLSQVKNISGVNIVYKVSGLENIKTQAIHLKNVSVDEALAFILKDSGYSYSFTDGVYVISKDNRQTKRKITGYIKDKKGNPLPGVTVRIKETNMGTASEVNGYFSLNIPMKETVLIFTYIGFKTREITIDISTEEISVVMEEEIRELDESVVIAYGNVKKRDLTGSVSVVKADEIKGIPSVSISNLLQGRMAGVDITNMSGSPGGGGTIITIRGFNSLGVEQERRYSDPLWVVDGVPLFSFTSPVTGTNLLCDLNPEMIESVEVLKDASAAAIYGSRAANGVIMVTTKRGKKGQKPVLTLNVSQTWGIVPEFPTITTGNEERLFRLRQSEISEQIVFDRATQREVLQPFFMGKRYLIAVGSKPYLYHFLCDSTQNVWNNSSNFFPIYYGTGKVTNANLQTYGGKEDMTYGLGVGYYKEDGVFRGTGFNRIDCNGQFSLIPIDKVEIDFRVNFSLIKRKRAEKGLEIQNAAPILETVPGDPYELSSLMPGKDSFIWNNILKQMKAFHESNEDIRLRSNIRFKYHILEDLSFTVMGAVDYSLNRRNTFLPDFWNRSQGNLYINKTVGESGNNLMGLNENLLSYIKSWNEGVHNLNIVGGTSVEYNRTEYNGGHAQDLPDDNIYYASGNLPDHTIYKPNQYTEIYVALQKYRSGKKEKRLISFFGRAEYNYKQKYYASLSYRTDGSSVFGENNKWGSFPAAALAYTFTEEKFAKTYLPWLNFGKIRASWGRSGMQFYNAYLALGILEVGTPFLDKSTLTPNWYEGLYNKDLCWEETDQYDLGVDLNFLDNRLQITADYYYRYTDKLLTLIQTNGLIGYENLWTNAAAISNEGYEFLIKYEIFRRPDLYWKASVNGAKNWNTYRKSYTGMDDLHGVIGRPLNQIYAYKTNGFYDTQDEVPVYYDNRGNTMFLKYGMGARQTYPFMAGDFKITDMNNDDIINDKDKIASGSALPDFSGGILNEFRWKNFDLNILFTYQLGRHMIYKPKYNSMDVGNIFWNINRANKPLLLNLRKEKFWEKPGDRNCMPKINSTFYGFSSDVDVYIEKVNWMKFKTVTMGYSLPSFISKKMKMEEFRVFISGENLWTFTNYSGLDPETVDIATGIDNGVAYPLARKISIGLTLKF